jgi:hypothetical protein
LDKRSVKAFTDQRCHTAHTAVDKSSDATRRSSAASTRNGRQARDIAVHRLNNIGDALNPGDHQPAAALQIRDGLMRARRHLSR